MAAYIAMLRGVNVSGHNTIKMDVLRGLCQGLGFRNVETYVQSGNIVFQTATENPAALSKRIGETILESFGLDRKSTRLNSSHRCISYAVFCLKKKNRETATT